MKNGAYDLTAASGTALILSDLWNQWATPVLQGVALVLGVVFLALGVALRWREYRSGRCVGGDLEC